MSTKTSPRFVCNEDISQVAQNARARAAESFAFFANYVLGFALPEDVVLTCEIALFGEKDFAVNTPRTRALASALSVWLAMRGVKVLCDSPLDLKHETLDWLSLGVAAICGEARSVRLNVSRDSVEVLWLA